MNSYDLYKKTKKLDTSYLDGIFAKQMIYNYIHICGVKEKTYDTFNTTEDLKHRHN